MTEIVKVCRLLLSASDCDHLLLATTDWSFNTCMHVDIQNWLSLRSRVFSSSDTTICSNFVQRKLLAQPEPIHVKAGLCQLELRRYLRYF